MSNSVNPDETAHYEPSHLDLRCLQKPIIIAYGSERVKRKSAGFEHAQHERVQIILRLRKVSLGPCSPFIHSVVSNDSVS